MRETTVLFGETKSIVGVVTDPGEDAPRRDHACLLLNSGYIHRAGPQRLYVKMARRLARAGFVTLRFDYSGIGDSPMRQDNLQFAEVSIREAQDAMDFLESSRGIGQFIASGICWGGDNALGVCHADPRVVGAYPVDFYALPSVRQWLRLYVPRLLRARSWANLLGGKTSVLAQGAGIVGAGFKRLLKKPAQNGAETASLPTDSSQIVLAEVEAILARGGHLGFVFTRGGPSIDHYKAKFRDSMRKQEAETGRISVECMETDHLFTLLSSQQALLDSLERWMIEVTGAQTEPPVPQPASVD